MCLIDLRQSKIKIFISYKQLCYIWDDKLIVNLSDLKRINAIHNEKGTQTINSSCGPNQQKTE